MKNMSITLNTQPIRFFNRTGMFAIYCLLACEFECHSYGGEHTGVIRGVFPGDIEGGSVSRRGPEKRKSPGGVNHRVPAPQIFNPGKQLVMIHKKQAGRFSFEKELPDAV